MKSGLNLICIHKLIIFFPEKKIEEGKAVNINSNIIEYENTCQEDKQKENTNGGKLIKSNRKRKGCQKDKVTDKSMILI